MAPSESTENLIDLLIKAAREHKDDPDGFEEQLRSQIASKVRNLGELQHATASLRIALANYTIEKYGKASNMSCSFCGRAEDRVLRVMASSQAAICNDCVFTAMDKLGTTMDAPHLRFAFSVFKLLLRGGYFIVKPWLRPRVEDTRVAPNETPRP